MGTQHIFKWPFLGLMAIAGAFLIPSTPQTAFAVRCDQFVPQQQECIEKEPYLVKEYSVKGYTSLTVFTPGGDIEVYQSTDSEKVRIELYVNQGFYSWLFGNNLENYRITNVKRGHEIITSVEKKSKERSTFWDSNTTFSYKIYVPSVASTNLKTLGGSIHIEDIKGEHWLKSSGGDITATDVSGLVKAYTSGGNVMITDSKGALYAHTNGGDISVDESMGEIRLQTNGGKISGWNISGSMIAKVNGGDIQAHFKQLSHGINLQTAAGNIMLSVPDSTGYSIFANATQIQLDRSIPFRGTQSTRAMEGALYGGGIPLHLATSSGTITLKMYK